MARVKLDDIERTAFKKAYNSKCYMCNFLKTNNEVLSSIIGSIAAGLACQKEGNVTISPDEILEYLNKLEKMSNLVDF